jgi:hypothetical protein
MSPAKFFSFDPEADEVNAKFSALLIRFDDTALAYRASYLSGPITPLMVLETLGLSMYFKRPLISPLAFWSMNRAAPSENAFFSLGRSFL